MAAAGAGAAAALPKDFPLGRTKVLRIRDILCELTVLLTNWAEITDYFLESPTDGLLIKRMIQRNANMQIVVLRTLEMWIEREGEKATFDACIKILNQRGFLDATRRLEQQRHIIHLIPDSQVVVRQYDYEPRQKLFHKVPMLSTYFSGRTTALADQHDKITRPGRMLVLSGLGGVGKTTLATAYAHQRFQNFYDFVIWIDASSGESMENCFRNLAPMFKVNGARAIREIILKIYGQLVDSKTLFIFDNAIEFKGENGIHNFFTPVSYNRSEQVPYMLVTTRKLDLIVSSEFLKLDNLSVPEAIEFLHRWIQVEPPEPLSSQLVEMLSCLPLALEQAGAFLRRESLLTNDSSTTVIVANYIEQYKLNAKKILDDKTFQSCTLSTYEHTTLVTWLVTLDRIKALEGGSVAIALLEMLAYFEPNQIPIDFFVLVAESESEIPKAATATLIFRKIFRPTPSTVLETDLQTLSSSCVWDGQEAGLRERQNVIESLQHLTIYSMIHLDGRSFINMHSIVQDVIRVNAAAPREKAHLRTLLKTLAKVVIPTTSSFKYSLFIPPLGNTCWTQFKQEVRPHSKTLALHAIGREDLVKEFPTLFLSILVNLRNQGNYLEVRKFVIQIVPKFQAIYGNDGVLVIMFLSIHTNSLGEDAADVIHQVQSVTAAAKRAGLDQNHASLMTILAKLNFVLTLANCNCSTRSTEEVELELLIRRHSGEPVEDFLQKLAKSDHLNLEGKRDESLEILKTIYIKFASVLIGNCHQVDAQILPILSQLAGRLSRRKEYKDAEVIYSMMQEIQAGRLGRNHRDYLTTSRCLAETKFKDCFKYEHIEKLQQIAHEQKRLYGSTEDDHVLTWTRIAQFLMNSTRNEDAEEMIKRVIGIQKVGRSGSGRGNINAKLIYANLLVRLGRLVDAEIILQDVVQTKELLKFEERFERFMRKISAPPELIEAIKFIDTIEYFRF